MNTHPPLISVQTTEHLVDALNQVVEIEGDAEARIEFLLHRLQEMLNRSTRCALWLMEDLNRKPVPIIRARTVVRPDFDNGPMGSVEAAQKALEDSAPLSQIMVRKVLDNIRTPVTAIASESGTEKWFETVLVDRYLSLMGYADCIISMWAATRNRAIFLVVHRREIDPPFSEKDTTLVSLMLRAMAPIVDRELVQSAAINMHEQMSPREREILLMLLAGDSEKQIASNICRSVHTVHTFVRQIYRHFNVSSRGELMAQFVDKAVVESLRQTTLS